MPPPRMVIRSGLVLVIVRCVLEKLKYGLQPGLSLVATCRVRRIDCSGILVAKNMLMYSDR
jgi:hypothetical protein